MSQPIQYAVPSAALYYTPPYRFAAPRFALVLPVALLLAASVGAGYGLAEFHGRTMYTRVGAVALAGVVLGFLTAGVLLVGRVHHRGLAVLTGTLVGAVALWASWVVWVERVLNRWEIDIAFSDLVVHPTLLYELVRQIKSVGTWNYNNQTFHGPVLWIIWVLEALIILVVCTTVASKIGKPGLFCASCSKRCRHVGGLGRYNGHYTDEVRQNLEAHHFDYLLELGPVMNEDDPEIVLELQSCNCGRTNVLGASRIVWDDNGQGSFILKQQPLVEGLLLDAEGVDAVKSLKGRLPPVPDDGGETNDEDPDSGEPKTESENDDDPSSETRL